jgi:valyl-tRNA synthetase
MSKGRLRDLAGRELAQRVLAGVLDAILRLVQPIMPFVAESIWQALADAAFERGLPTPEPAAASVVIAPWPILPARWLDPAMERRVARMQELVRAVREVRNRYQIDAKTSLDVSVRCNSAVARDFQTLAPFITALAGVDRLESGTDLSRPLQAASFVHPEFEAYVPLQGLIDVPAELKRLEKQLADKRRYLQAAEAKLQNPSFVGRAPAEVVQQQREQVDELRKQTAAVETNLRELRPAAGATEK